MKRIIDIVFAAFLCILPLACEKSPESEKIVDNGVYPFSMSVWNQDYTDELVLEKMGQVEIASVEALPSWISGVTLSPDITGGNSVAQIAVKRTLELEEKQTADVTVKMTNGATVILTLVQWPGRSVTNEAVQSKNYNNLEVDWASTESILLSMGIKYENGRPKEVDEPVLLPWASRSIHHLPYGEVTRMLENKNDWRLVFNFTGVSTLPGSHYFGLYNRYTGILRVFYYLHRDDVPTNGNDHLWCFGLDPQLAEHTSAQFSLPYDEPVSANYIKYVSDPILVTPYANRSDDLEGGKYLPNQGWWAFDINMAASRKHDFFSENPREGAAKIEMKLYSEDNVMLNSILQGDIDGKLTGKINLDALVPKSTTATGLFGGAAFSAIGGGLGSMFTLQSFFGDPKDQLFGKEHIGGIIATFLGSAFNAGGKLTESLAKKKPTDEDLGTINADINLDLNATMTTKGIIGGSRTTKIPPASVDIQDFKRTTSSGEPNGFGKGVWNIRKHPVVYVVKDAYWSEFNFVCKSTGKDETEITAEQDGAEVHFYQLGSDADRPGLRLISFLDPTSVEGIYLSDDLFDSGISSCQVQLAYGVYPGSELGYTRQFRQAAGLNLTTTWRLSNLSTFNTLQDASSLDFKLFKHKKSDPIFHNTGEIDSELADYVAYRRSEQTLSKTVVRRYYGPSSYFTKEVATPYEVDEVHFVSDPQIDVPVDIENKRILDPVLPDFVVTGVIRVQGRDPQDSEDQIMVNTLRFAPEIKFISYKDLPSIYQQMVNRSKNMSNITGGVSVDWVFMQDQLDKVKDFRDAAK